MSTQLWKTTWVENGRKRELVFQSLNSLMIARIDFKLKYPHAFKDGRAPDSYQIEEVQDAGNKLTRCTLLGW